MPALPPPWLHNVATTAFEKQESEQQASALHEIPVHRNLWVTCDYMIFPPAHGHCVDNKRGTAIAYC